MSAIAKTSSITLITGVPGNGKTLRTVWYIKQAVEAGEEVFVCNLNGLAVEGVSDFPDPTRWEELPPGAVLVVDEAQRFFRAATGAVPAYIQAMETIRHSGIRLILVTQSPALIHTNIRALVGLHEHLVRENGQESATVYRRNRTIDNVRSDKALAAEDHERWSFPTECYALYKSAEVHTVKRTIKSKYKRGMVLAGIAAAILGVVMWQVQKIANPPEKQQAGGTTLAPAGVGLPAGVKAELPRYASATDYAKAHLPRFASMPWTMPIFDDRAAASDPRLFCMSSLPVEGDPGDPSCTCLTEQGTRYEMSQPECRTVARHGVPYNPYMQRSEGAPMPAVSPAQPVPAPAPAFAGSVVAGEPAEVVGAGIGVQGATLR